MAKKRKKPARRVHHRRRIGAVHGQNEVMEAAGLVVGSVLSTVVQRVAHNVNAKIVAGGQIVAGIMVKKHWHTPFATGVGYGMMAVGSVHLVHDFGLINGIEDSMSGLFDGGFQNYVGTEHNTNGITNNAYLNGISNNSHVSGTGGYQEGDPISWSMGMS